MRRFLLAVLLVVPITFAGCHSKIGFFDEGPHPAIWVDETSVQLEATYGNYPANWTPWGHVTLVGDDHMVWDSSEGLSSGLAIHKLLDDGSWRHVDTYRFWGNGNHGSLSFRETGNYSLSDVDRGQPGAGIHANVTVLNSKQGCTPSQLGRICEFYQPPRDVNERPPLEA